MAVEYPQSLMDDSGRMRDGGHMQGRFKIVFGTELLDESNSEIIHYAIKSGITSFDTADCYGKGTSESTLGAVLSCYDRKELFIASKCGVKFHSDGAIAVDGARDYILKSCEASLKRLKTDYIDLYYLHRVSKSTRIEESMLALKELISQNKINGIGLSEVTADQIRRAYKIHPITAVQIEYSPWSRQDESNDVINTCRELNILVLGYSPLGRAFFTSKNEEYFKNLGGDDYRRSLPRYNDKFLTNNLAQRAAIDAHAKKIGCTTAQLVLAWELSKDITPVFWTKNKVHLDENIRALTLGLSKQELAEADAIIASFNVYGARYPSEKVSGIFTENDDKTSVLAKSSFFACSGISPQLTSAHSPPQPRADLVSENFSKLK